eukprot:TRINITY_DN14460_c0_g1_i1.p1 TRINITY_DN14460_c0_g1~~TRINITY_DN14460_c0_g1_i1.p1  ORF type:complete len:328 (-),score=102.47 TRINITY_DN14460_c0_g1_i1:46-993(-)
MPAINTINVWTGEALEKAAKDNLGEDKGRLKDDLKALKSWISKSPHLHSIRKDDEYLTMFLRGCKFSLERTKEKLDFHHTVRGNLPSWFDSWDPRQPQLQAILKAGMYLPLKGYDRHGRRVILMRAGGSDPNTMKKEDEFKVSTMVMEHAMDGDDQASICGIVLIQDMGGMTAAHALSMNPVMAKKAMTVWQDAYPARPKALHFINMPPVIESVFKMMEGFQKEKMKKRNHVHPKGDMSKMQEDLGLDILPKEYGGTNGTVEELTSFWMEEMEKNRDWLMEQTKFKTDEAKRPGKPKLHSDIFGIEGSFRKLEID